MGTLLFACDVDVIHTSCNVNVIKQSFWLSGLEEKMLKEIFLLAFNLEV